MCIAIYKPKGLNKPTIEELKTCFTNNPDGSGFMASVNNKVIIRKGFMTFDAFIKGYNKFLADYKVNENEIPMVFHFRITTQGGVKKELCHPYPLCTKYGTMKSTKVIADIGVVHNGIIDLTTSFKTDVDHNDTMEFIKDYLVDIINWDISFYTKKNKVRLIQRLTNGSRLAILDKHGHCTLTGNWLEKDGLYYSNTSYLPRVPKQAPLYGYHEGIYDDWYDEEGVYNWGGWKTTYKGGTDEQ